MSKTSDIPGLAKYLPARPTKVEPGYCKDCGKKIEGYDQTLVDQGFWQQSYCDNCLDIGADDDD